jgi:hypothetical protein
MRPWILRAGGIDRIESAARQPKSALEESKAILDALQWAMGGSPNQVAGPIATSRHFWPQKGRRNVTAKNVPIRLYTEPDVVWWIEIMGATTPP